MPATPAKLEVLSPELSKAIALFEGRMETAQPEAQASAYLGASLTDSGLATWLPSSGSADADLLPELPLMRSRMRDLIRNNGLLSGAVQTFVDNILGVGLKLNYLPNYKALGLDAEWAKDFKAEVEARWEGFANTTDCDAQRRLDLGGLATLFYRGAFTNGDGLALPVWRPELDGPSATRIWVIESDRLSTPDGMVDGPALRSGVELDRFGAARAYHFRKTHPGDAYLTGAWFTGEIAQWRRVPAYTPWGRKRVIHGYQINRAGQVRGEPTGASVLADSRMLDHYVKTELKAAIVNGLIAAFIQTPLGQEGTDEILGRLAGSVVDPTTGEFDFDPRAYLSTVNQLRPKLQGGSMITLLPGEELKSHIPNRPGNIFPEFVKTLQTFLARGLGVSRHALTQDVSDANYGSIRVNLLNDWKFYTGRRHWLARNFYQEVFCLWFEEEVNKNGLKAPDYYRLRRAYTRALWGGPGRGWIDPTKEASAAVMRIQNNLSTLQQECSEQGLDYEDVIEQRAREAALLKEAAERHGVEVMAPAQISISVTDSPQKEDDDK